MEAYVREHIPLSAGMDVRVIEASPAGVIIEAPLGPNLNHRSTAFGGSVAALAILAGWIFVHLRLRSEGFVARTVIQRSAVRYEAPIRGAFRAVCEPVGSEVYERFTRALSTRGKGRVPVTVRIEDTHGVVGATFTGAYVALMGEESHGDA